MVKMGKRNKRISLHQKYKVAKKVRQHNKEVKKVLKSKGKKGLREKVQEIPGCVPFKADILQSMAVAKEQEKAHLKKRLVELTALSKKKLESERENKAAPKDSSRIFVGDLKKTLDEANIIIQVLDARDPNGTRSLEVEKEIKATNKTLIFLLNKIDLVPVDNMKAWLRHLSKEVKVFPFKANGEIKNENIKIKANSNARYVPSFKKKRPAEIYGVVELTNYLKLLISEATVIGSLDKLVVGVIGVPNTGKSSVINSLKNKEVCDVGIIPGITRNLQKIDFNNDIILIDSPGLVLSKSNDQIESVLRNCVRVEKIEDIQSVAKVIFNKCPKVQFQELYRLKDLHTYEEFIKIFALKCCPLKKGGIPNIRQASIRLINDWNHGKIAFCTQPPLMNEDVIDCLTFEQDAAIRSLTTKAIWIETGITELVGSGPLMSIMDVDESDDSDENDASNNISESDSDDVDMNE